MAQKDDGFRMHVAGFHTPAKGARSNDDETVDRIVVGAHPSDCGKLEDAAVLVFEMPIV
jgi:hypothetical protein